MIKDTPFEGPERELKNLITSSSSKIEIINNENKDISQSEVIDRIINFIEGKENNIFILTGGAGTGKTTIIKEIYNFLIKKQKQFKITSPTGKATYNLIHRIGNQINNDNIKTIFSQLYDLENMVNIKSKDVLFFETKKLDDDIYIIDEAGLIGLVIKKDENNYQQNILNFGSGSLLKDLLENMGSNTKIIFVGDPFQLHPIGNSKTYALDKEFYLSLNNEEDKNDYFNKNNLKNIGVNSNLNFGVETIELFKNYRQEEGNGIAINSQNVKNALINKNFSFLLESNENTFIFKDKNLYINKLNEIYKSNKENILVSYTNNSRYEYNNIIRKDILGFKNKINIGEKIILLNNFTLGEDVFFNGEIVEIISINGEVDVYNDVFIKDKDKNTKKIDLEFLDIDIVKHFGSKEKTFNFKLCLNSLNSNENGSGDDINLFKFISSFFENKMKKSGWNSKIINKKRFFYKSEEAKNNQEILELENQEYLNIKYQDKYYNSLHANYGYAITCHKSQGSEWNNVFIDIDSYSQAKTNENFLRFLYTGITRAKKNIFILNNDENLINDTNSYEDFAGKFGIEEIFMKNYINKIQTKLKEYDYFIVSIDKFNYQLQLSITNGEKDGKIAFWYNSKNKFTKKQSIHDNGFNQTIIQILNDNKL